MSAIVETGRLTHAEFMGKARGSFAEAARGCKSVTVRDASVVEYFGLGELWGNRTLFNEIKFSGQRGRVVYEPDKSVSADGHVHNLISALRTVMEKAERESPDSRFGIALSGGMDSRTLLAAAPDGMVAETFTFGAASSDDVRLAAEVAKRLGSQRHRHYPIEASKVHRYHDEVIDAAGGMWDLGQAFSIPIIKDVGKRLDVVMDGFSTDYLLGGGASMMLKTPEAFAASRRLFSDSELRKLLNPKLHTKIRPVLDAAIDAEVRKLESKTVIDRTDEIAMNAHAAANNVGYIAPRQHYTTFTPHAHPLFVKAATAIPAELRAWHGIYGPFMEALSPEAAAIPYASELFPPSYPQKLRTAGRLYVSARRRAIRLASRLHPQLMDGYTYIDMRGWWHNAPSWRNSLLSALNLENEWLQQDYVDSLVKAQNGGRDLTKKLIRIATFKLACDRWCS